MAKPSKPLTPCPFCGYGRPMVDSRTDIGFYVLCRCGACGAVRSTPKAAERAWDKRVAAPATDDEKPSLLTCGFCGRKHLSPRCPVVTTIGRAAIDMCIKTCVDLGAETAADALRAVIAEHGDEDTTDVGRDLLGRMREPLE